MSGLFVACMSPLFDRFGIAHYAIVKQYFCLTLAVRVQISAGLSV